MRRVPDPYLRERTADIEDVCKRVLRNFSPEPEEALAEQPDHQHILVAYDLNPSDTASMDRNHVLGFATEVGSINSHTAILARSLGIPAIVGLQNAIFNLHALAPAILDGYTGKLIVNPDPATRKHYEEIQAEKTRLRTALEKLRDTETVTKDGRRLTLSANIEFEHELDLVVPASGARRAWASSAPSSSSSSREETAGRGSPSTRLYCRTSRRSVSAPPGHLPHPRRRRGDKVPGRAAHRTGTKPLPRLAGHPLLALAPGAISSRNSSAPSCAPGTCRATVGMMFPLVSGVAGGARGQGARGTSAIAELAERERALQPGRSKLGAMIEVPSAAMVAERHRGRSRLPLDRDQRPDPVHRGGRPRESEGRRASTGPGHPGCHPPDQDRRSTGPPRHRIWTGVCGEMAGDLLYPARSSSASGMDELSVGAPLVPFVKEAVRQPELQGLPATARTPGRQGPGETMEIIALCRHIAQDAYPDLLEQVGQERALIPGLGMNEHEVRSSESFLVGFPPLPMTIVN